MKTLPVVRPEGNVPESARLGGEEGNVPVLLSRLKESIGFFEKITFNTSYFASMLKHRLLGFAGEAFHFESHHSVAIDSLTPGNYLSTPGLWIGLVFAAAFVAAAIRLRRYRGPI